MDSAPLQPSTSSRKLFVGVPPTVRQSIVRAQDDLDAESCLPSAKDLSSAEFSHCSGEFMLHPEGSFHCTFDNIVIFSCAASLVTIPFVVSVLINQTLPRFYVVADLVLESVLLADIVSVFFTSFYDEGEYATGISALVTDRRTVCMRYLHTTFLRDVAFSLPLDTVCDLAGMGHPGLLYLQLYRFVARAIRLHYVIREGRYLLPRTYLKFEVSFRALDGQFTFIKFLSGVLYIFHVATCCNVAFEVEVENIRYDEYIAVKRYVDAFFRTELLMIGVGRQKTEDTDGPWGLFFLCVFVLVGSAMLGFLFAQVAEVLNRLNLEKREHLVYTTKLRRAMRSMGIDKNLQNKLHLWSEQQWYMYTRSGEAFVEQIFESDMLNSSLKHELALQVRTEIIAQFHCLAMLQEISQVSVYAKVLLSDICQLLKQRIYLPGDFLCRRKTHAVKAHILLTGQCCSDTIVDRGGDLVVTESCNSTSRDSSNLPSTSSGESKPQDRSTRNTWMHTLRLRAPRFCNAQALLYKGTTYFASLVATSNCEVYEVSAEAYCKCLQHYDVNEEARCVLDAFENELFQTLSVLELEYLRDPTPTKKTPDPSSSYPHVWALPTSHSGSLEGLPENGVFDTEDSISEAGPISSPIMNSVSMISTRTNPEMQKLRRQQSYVSKINTASNLNSATMINNNNTPSARRFSSISHLWSHRSVAQGQISPSVSHSSQMFRSLPNFSVTPQPLNPVFTKSSAASTAAYLGLNPALHTDGEKHLHRSMSASPATSTVNAPDMFTFPRPESPDSVVQEDPLSQRDDRPCVSLQAPEAVPDTHSTPKTASTDNCRSPTIIQPTTGEPSCNKAPAIEEEEEHEREPSLSGGDSLWPPAPRRPSRANLGALASMQKTTCLPPLTNLAEARFPRHRVLQQETEADAHSLQVLMEDINRKLDLLLVKNDR